MQKQIYILFFAACALLVWLFRYDISPTGGPFAFRLDRWSGDVVFLREDRIYPSTEQKKPKPSNEPNPFDKFDK
jgi:hypothetical protein